jgi:hypothetical protein
MFARVAKSVVQTSGTWLADTLMKLFRRLGLFSAHETLFFGGRNFRRETEMGVFSPLFALFCS